MCLIIQVTGLIKLRKIRTLKELRQFLVELATSTIQSTIFLGVHGLVFMPVCCTGR
jgi:hypothetical protein